MIDKKHSIKKIIREEQITIKRIRTKVYTKIKLNQILRDKIKKNITIKRLRIKFEIINK
jgi:hypothetical protein